MRLRSRPRCFFARGLGAAALASGMLLPPQAHAALMNCTLGAISGIGVVYNPASPTILVASGTVTLNCTKTGNNVDTRYYELGATSGLNANGSQRQAANGAGLIAYGLSRDASLVNGWGDTSGSRLSGTITSATSTSLNVGFWFGVPANQWVAAGTYTDTITVKLYQGPEPVPASVDTNPYTATFGLTLTVLNQCTLSSPPGALFLSYTSFQPTASTASSNFGVTCTSGTPYTASLDAAGGTLLGLNYALSIMPAVAQAGTGVAQNLSILGTLAAGQSGVCASSACSASEPRTLTITY